MDLRKIQLRKAIRKFFKTNKPKEDKPSLRLQVEEQRSGARSHSDSDETQRPERIKESGKENSVKKDEPSSPLQVKEQRSSVRRPHGSTPTSSKQGVGVNPLDLPESGQEPEGMKILAELSVILPHDSINEINSFSTKAHEARRNAEHMKKFGIDWDTAKEMKRVLDQNTLFKDAMSLLPGMMKILTVKPTSPSFYLFSVKRIAEDISNIPDVPAELKILIEAKIGAIMLATNKHDLSRAANDFWCVLSAVGIEMY